MLALTGPLSLSTLILSHISFQKSIGFSPFHKIIFGGGRDILLTLSDQGTRGF